MDVKPIKTDEDYTLALAAIEQLMDAEPDTPEGDRLDVLTTLVEAYESRHFPIDEPDPVEAIQHQMEAMGLARQDLVTIIGSSGRISEVLSRKRPLTLGMIRRLNAHLHIPAEVLIRPYELRDDVSQKSTAS